MRARYCGVLFTLILASCAVGPDYEPLNGGSAVVDEGWHGVLPHGGSVANLEQWWSQFDDPVLTLLITRAEKDSPTIDAALARVNQARATYRKSIGGLLPSLSASASKRRAQTGGADVDTIRTDSSAQIDAAWEIDLFGGQRRAIEGTLAEEEARAAGWHDARVTLAAEVATAYVGLRACAATLTLYQELLASQVGTRDLVSLQAKAGLVSASDSDLASASASNAASTVENQKGVCAQRFNLLAQLVVIPAADLQSILYTAPDAIPVPRSATITTMPAATIEQRPDVAVAERNVAAASAAIGVAVAQRLPSLTLAGAIGVNKAAGTSSVGTWSFGPTVSLPLFNGGALIAEEDRTRAVFDETVATYRATVLVAVKEVEDALARLSAVGRRYKEAENAVASYRDYLKGAEANYKAGRVSLLDLEESRRLVYSAEQTFVLVRQERAEAWIAMYKAVGGGWNKKFETNEAKASWTPPRR